MSRRPSSFTTAAHIVLALLAAGVFVVSGFAAFMTIGMTHLDGAKGDLLLDVSMLILPVASLVAIGFCFVQAFRRR